MTDRNCFLGRPHSRENSPPVRNLAKDGKKTETDHSYDYFPDSNLGELRAFARVILVYVSLCCENLIGEPCNPL